MSQYALKTSGSGFTVWGAGVGTDVATVNNKKAPYDASDYSGLRFWAKSGGDDLTLRVKLQDGNTTPEGGVCSDAAMKCNDTFGQFVDITLMCAPSTWRMSTSAPRRRSVE